MYFPSDSWGKFGKDKKQDMDNVAYEILNRGVPYQPFGTMEELKTVASLIFNQSSFSSMTRLEIMKHILEGRRMPVLNPKTGEQDYVDIGLVNKIVVDSEYVEDIVRNDKFKFDITLSGNEEKQEVSVTASNVDLKVREAATLTIQAFEEMLFKAINEAKDQRLEDVEEFKAITDGLISKIVADEMAIGKYLARIEMEYCISSGIGIIRDMKADQDVGTFEGFRYTYDKNRRIAGIEGIILSGRILQDLEEKDRFEFVYYSLENELQYSFIAGERSSIKTDSPKAAISIENYSLLVDVISSEHQYYDIAVQAQEKKALMQNIDSSHPLYDTQLEQFRQSRLVILEESKNKQKQQKLVSQFSDIDIDL